MKSYKVYYKPYGSKAKQGDSLTIIAPSSDGAKSLARRELARRGRFTIIRVKLIRR